MNSPTGHSEAEYAIIIITIIIIIICVSVSMSVCMSICVCGTAGSEGKLSSVTHKLSLLTAVANLSHNAVSGVDSIESLSTTIIDLFISLISNEGQS